MKKILLFLAISLSFTLFSGEKEELLKTFAQEREAERKGLDSAKTQVELTGSMGAVSSLEESQAIRALEFKLRQTPDKAERLQLLTDFNLLTHKIRRIIDAPREGGGSMAAMHCYAYTGSLWAQYREVLMLNEDEAARWKRISGAAGKIGDKNITFQNGLAEFSLPGEELPLKYRIMLYPRQTFSWNSRDFALIVCDIAGAGNDDFTETFLIEVKDKKIVRARKYGTFYFDRIEVRGNRLFIYHNDQLKIVSLESV